MFQFAYYVFNADGSVVTSYHTKAKAVEHAALIGGTWKKARR